MKNSKEMELWMERVPESIKKATKREPEMLASERAAMQQEELVKNNYEQTVLSKCQNTIQLDVDSGVEKGSSIRSTSKRSC